MHLLGNRTSALEADERPADERHCHQKRSGEGEVVTTCSSAYSVGENTERLIAVEQQQPRTEAKGPDHLGRDTGSHEDLERLTSNQIETSTGEQDDERDGRFLGGGGCVHAENRGHEPCRTEGNSRHGDDEGPHVGPTSKPAVTVGDQSA